MVSKVNFTFLENHCCTNIRTHYCIRWDEFVQLFGEHQVWDDKDHEMICPWIFISDTGPRRSENCLGTNLICLDFDDDSDWTIEDSKVVFAKYKHMGFTSYNHMKNGQDRFRIFLPLDRVYYSKEVQECRDGLYDKYQGVDRSCLSITRAFYIPSCSVENKNLAQLWSRDGELFSLDQFDRIVFTPEVNIERPELSDEKRQWILDSLKMCYIGKEPEWVKIGLAMCSEGFSFDEFVYVSVGGLMREKTTKDCQTKWKGFEQAVARGNRRSVGVIINVLKEYGFVYSKLTEKQKELDAIRERLRVLKQ